MKTKKILATAILSVAFLLTGCNPNKPEGYTFHDLEYCEWLTTTNADLWHYYLSKQGQMCGVSTDDGAQIYNVLLKGKDIILTNTEDTNDTMIVTIKDPQDLLFSETWDATITHNGKTYNETFGQYGVMEKIRQEQKQVKVSITVTPN